MSLDVGVYYGCVCGLQSAIYWLRQDKQFYLNHAAADKSITTIPLGMTMHEIERNIDDLLYYLHNRFLGINLRLPYVEVAV